MCIDICVCMCVYWCLCVCIGVCECVCVSVFFLCVCGLVCGCVLVLEVPVMHGLCIVDVLEPKFTPFKFVLCVELTL